MFLRRTDKAKKSTRAREPYAEIKKNRENYTVYLQNPPKHPILAFLAKSVCLVSLVTIFSSVASAFLITRISDIINQKREKDKIVNVVQSVYIGNNKEWVDANLGPAKYSREVDGLYQCVYINDYVAVNIFFDETAKSCKAYFVTLLRDDSIVSIRLPEIYDWIVQGKPLGQFSYYDIDYKPLSVYGRVTLGSHRAFYEEEYMLKAPELSMRYVFASLDYGIQLYPEELFENLLQHTDIPVDDEVDIDRIKNDKNDPDFDVISDRHVTCPNTFGIAEYDFDIKLIGDYSAFDSAPMTVSSATRK